MMNTRRRPQMRALALLVALCTLAAACGGSSSDDGAESAATRPVQDVGDPVDGGKLVYGLPAESNGWDPVAGNWAPWGLIVARTFFDTLTIFDEDGELQPNLLKSWSGNEDFTEWTLELREGITFHNDDVLDAEAVVANLEFFASSPLTGPVYQEYGPTYEVVSDLEVKATFEKGFNFPGALATQVGVMMAPEALTQDGPTRARNPIGTGPFILDEWIIDNHLTVVKNPDYWQEGLPHLDEIEFRPITDQNSRVAALQAGDVDLAFFDNPTGFNEFQNDEDFLVWQDPEAETAENFVMFNTQSGPAADPRLRRALAMALDAQTFVNVLTPGREVANGPYRENSRWYAPTDYPGYDPEAATALIEEIEAESGEVTITISSSPSVTVAEQVQLIAQMWSEIGVNVEIATSETATLIIDIATGNYEAALWRQFDSANPGLEVVWWHEFYVNDPGTLSLNFARNVNAELSAALDAARTTNDEAEQLAQFTIVQEQLATDIPYAWISHMEPAVVAEADVNGVFDYIIPDTDLRAMSYQNSAHMLPQVWIQPGD